MNSSRPSGYVRRIAACLAVAAVGALVAQAGFGAFGAGAAPPAPLVSSAPLRPAISTRATFAFDRRPGLAYECALDSNVYRSCSSPVTFGRLARSRHVFRVRARSAAGRASKKPSTYVWRVVPRGRSPQGRAFLRPRLTTAPVSPWISRNATFAWLEPRSTTAECRLDRRRWRGCTSPSSFSGLRLGRHVFHVRSKYADGSYGGKTRFVWKIVATPPPPPPRLTSVKTTATQAAFSFEIASGSTAECWLDAGAWKACESPVVYVGLTPRTHTFCVRAVGARGAVGRKTCADWSAVAPESLPESSEPFTIAGDLSEPLAPGTSAPLPVTISNRNGFDLRVTALTVDVRSGSSQPDCDGRANLRIAQSSIADGSTSIVVPALGSVTLPAQGATAPVVTMLDLDVNQDACKNAVFTFAYGGTGTHE